jgi:hypothetical protein
VAFAILALVGEIYAARRIQLGRIGGAFRFSLAALVGCPPGL